MVPRAILAVFACSAAIVAHSARVNGFSMHAAGATLAQTEHLAALAAVASATALTSLVRALPPSRQPGVPGPPRSTSWLRPFVGDFPDILPNLTQIPSYVYERTAALTRHQRSWTLCLPPVPGEFSGILVFLGSPSNVKHVLQENFDAYSKGVRFKENVRPLLGQGIFSSDGSVWRLHRKVASHMFSRRLLIQSVQVAARRCAAVSRNLVDAARDGHVIDLQRIFLAFTMDVFAEVAFGVELGSLERSSDDPHPFTVAFDAAQLRTRQVFGNPLAQLQRRWLPCSGVERRFRRHVKTIDEFALGIIRDRRALAREKDHALGPDLISRFIAGSAARPGPQRDGRRSGTVGKEAEARDRGGGPGERAPLHAPPRALTDRELRDVVINFLLAGRDTSAVALSWTLFELLRADASESSSESPLARVRAEADAALTDLEGLLGRAGDPAAPEDRGRALYDRVTKGLVFTRQCLTESLRLHPSVAINVRYADRDDTLPDGTKVPARSVVVYSPYSLGRNPDLYPDPLAFRPARWDPSRRADNAGDAPTEPRPADTAVFNVMPRLCLGKPLALAEMQLMLAYVVQRFDIALAEESAGADAGAYSTRIVMQMRHGLKVRLTQREFPVSRRTGGGLRSDPGAPPDPGSLEERLDSVESLGEDAGSAHLADRLARMEAAADSDEASSSEEGGSSEEEDASSGDASSGGASSGGGGGWDYG
jgi:cytochrome P450